MLHGNVSKFSIALACKTRTNESLCRSVDKLKRQLDEEKAGGSSTAHEEKSRVLEQLKEESLANVVLREQVAHFRNEHDMFLMVFEHQKSSVDHTHAHTHTHARTQNPHRGT